MRSLRNGSNKNATPCLFKKKEKIFIRFKPGFQNLFINDWFVLIVIILLKLCGNMFLGVSFTLAFSISSVYVFNWGGCVFFFFLFFIQFQLKKFLKMLFHCSISKLCNSNQVFIWKLIMNFSKNNSIKFKKLLWELAWFNKNFLWFDRH